MIITLVTSGEALRGNDMHVSAIQRIVSPSRSSNALETMGKLLNVLPTSASLKRLNTSNAIGIGNLRD